MRALHRDDSKAPRLVATRPEMPVGEGVADMRLIPFLFVIGFACCSLVSQDAVAQSHPLSPLLPSNVALGRIGMTRMWWANATLDPKRDKLSFLMLDDNYLFAHASNGMMCCFDSETGRKLWATALGGQDEPAYQPASNSKYVLIISGSILFALKKETGDIAWQFPLPDGPTTAPVVDDSQIYFGSADGSVVAYNLDKLAENFMKRRKSDAAYRAFVFKYRIPTRVLETPVVQGKFVAFAGSGTHISTYVLGQDRALKYTFDTPDPVTCGLAAHGDLLFVCSEDSQLYALNMLTGGMRWQAVMGAPVIRTPRSVENDLYVSPDEVGLRRFDLRTGEERWPRPVRGVENFLGVTRARGSKPGHVYGTSRTGDLIQINRDTGAVTGRLVLDRFRVRVHNELTDRIYVATETGIIVALREKDRDLPTYFKHPDRLPLMPEFAPEAGSPTQTPAGSETPDSEKAAETTSEPASTDAKSE